MVNCSCLPPCGGRTLADSGLDRRIALVASSQGGVFTVRQALEVGFSRQQISTRRQNGRWLPQAPRTYVIAGVPESFERRAWVALLTCPLGAAISHNTAAYLMKIIDNPPDVIDVTVPRDMHHPLPHRVRVHRARSLGRQDIRRLDGIPLTCPARVVSDLATVLDRTRLEAILDVALELGFVTTKSLRRYLCDRSLVSRPGGALLGQLLRDRERGVPGSELERAFLRIVRRARLPEPERQFRVGPRRVDFAYPHVRIAIELDGLAHHRSKAAFVDDRRRQNFLVLEGWVVLRFTWDDLAKHEEEIVATIRDALTTS
jgi:very-short-patch-repair endonuclease